MPVIKDEKQFQSAINRGISYIQRQCDYRRNETLDFLEHGIGRSAKTISHWRYAKIHTTIDDELLYGFAWLVMTRGGAPLEWLVDLFSATTAIVVEPATEGWVRACFKWARHWEENSPHPRLPTSEEIDLLVQQCFSSIKSMPAEKGLPGWTNRALAVLRLVETNPNRSTPLAPMERYWDGMPRQGMPLQQIDNEYPVLRDVLAHVRQTGNFEMQVDMTMLLIHYMHARWLLDDRLKYVYSAIDAAQQFTNRCDGLWIEAMLLIDGAGWVLMEQERYLTAMDKIDEGLRIAGDIEPEPETGFQDLTVLGYTYKALLSLQTNIDVAQATDYLDHVRHLKCRPIVKLHFYQAMLMIAAIQQDEDRVQEIHYQGIIQYQHDTTVVKALFWLNSADAYLQFKQLWKVRAFLQTPERINADGALSLPCYVMMKILAARIAITEDKPELACQELRELFRMLETKQKSHVESRLLRNARRLYEEVRDMCG